MTMTIGPVQLLVIGFSQPTFDGRIRAQLDRLRESETIRVLDLALVHKDEEGNLEHLRMTDLSVGEAEEMGALVGALIGLGAGGEAGAELGAAAGAEAGEDGHLLPEDVWYIEDVLEDAEAAAVVLIEHRWAIGLRDAVREAGGFHLSDAWVHPLDLVSIGLMEASEVEGELGSAR
jgi:uncharacterized membrane protein